MIISRSLLLPIIIMLFGAGCSGVNKSYPERAYFQFEPRYTSAPERPIKGTVVEFKRFSVSPGSQGTEFIYRIGEFQYQTDFYNQFFKPPSSLLTEAANRWFDEAGIFEDLLDQMSQVFPNYLIEGNVVKLYGDYRNQSTPKAILEIQLFMLKINEDDDEPSILFGKTYSVEKPIASMNPTALMQGWNLAFEEILGEFLLDVKRNVRGQPKRLSSQGQRDRD